MSQTTHRPQRYGFGKVYKRGDAWWISWYSNGDRRESVARVLGKPVSAVTERDAYKLLGERLKGKARGETVLARYERATVATMLADYERKLEIEKPDTVDASRAGIRATTKWLGAERVATLDLVGLTQAAHAQEHTWSRGTIKHHLGVLQAALRYWKRAKRLTTVPDFPILTGSPARQGYFTDEDMLALTASMPEVAADIAWTQYYLGWRLMEVIPLTWDRVDLRERTIRLTHSKGDETGRLRPIIEAPFLALLERRRHQRVLGQPWVFWRTLHGGRAGARVDQTWYRHQWKRALTAAGLTDKVPHDFRRTAYVNLVNAGVDLATAMELVGHKTLASAVRYQIIDVRRQRLALERLEAHREALDARKPQPHGARRARALGVPVARPGAGA